MKIALFNTMSPYVKGGAEILVEDLYRQLVLRGYTVVLFRIPFSEDFETGLLQTVLAAKTLDFSDYDVLVSFKFPAYCAVHRNHKLWIFHQFRQVYDLFGKKDGIADNEAGRAIKSTVAEIDNLAIGTVQNVFMIANEVAKRLKEYNGLESEVLNPPLQQADRYHAGECGDYIYYPSRITKLKRQHLAISAMKYVKTDVKLILDGQCSEPEYIQELLDLIHSNYLEEKVILNNRWVSDDEKIDKMANCLAVMFIPFKEDYGLVTLEGFYSSKPVISCHDSGGTKEFIEHGVNGMFAEPEPQSIAACIDSLYRNRKKAVAMGEESYKYIVKRDITWDKTVRRLLS